MDEQVTDAELEKLEEELKKLEGKDTGYGAPTAAQKDGVFKFFRDILKLKDTTRVGNLNSPEIGLSRLSVRGNKSIALYAGVEGLDIVKDYFLDQSNILTESSMAKNGFFLQTVVTQIKKEKKIKDTATQKKGWFSKKTEGGE